MSYQSSDRQGHRSGNRLIYSLLSALIPGTGQILAGYRWRGAIMIVVSLVILAGVIIAYVQGVNTLLSYVVQPRVLIGIFVVNVLVLVFRVGSIVDAYWSPQPVEDRKPAGWRGGLVALALGVMLTVTAAPHAVLGYYTYLTYDTLNQVFSVEEIADDLADEEQSSSSDSDDSGTSSSKVRPGEAETPTPAPSPTSTPES